MVDSIREALEKAAEEQKPTEPVSPETAAPTEGVAETGGSTQDSKKPVGAAESEETLSKDAEVTPTPTEDKPTEQVKSVAVDVTDKAPVSWTPATREHWGRLPSEVRAEIQKREVEIQRGLAQASQARKFGDEFHKTVAPFESIIRASNVTPMQAVGNLMQTAATLQMGSVQQKAQLVATIIKDFGVDIAALDSVLSGVVEPQDNQKVQLEQLLSTKLSPVMKFMDEVSTARAAREEQHVQTVQQDIGKISTKEFYEDLRLDMADLIEVRSRRGQNLNLEQAYDLALQARPDLKQVLSNRSTSQQSAESVARAAQLASGIGRTAPPALNGVVDSSSIRGAMEAAIGKLRN